MRNSFIGLLIILSIQSFYAQRNDNNSWFLGIGVNVINDSGEIISDFFNISENYNFKNPFSVSIEKRFSDSHSLESLASNNLYVTGKRINGQILEEDQSFLAVDLHYKNYVSSAWQNVYRSTYEIYLLVGSGVTIIDNNNSVNFNVGTGTNFLLSEQIKLNIQAMGKVGIKSNLDSASNYLQLNIGLIFRLNGIDNCGCFL